jgi:hypothetical protein
MRLARKRAPKIKQSAKDRKAQERLLSDHLEAEERRNEANRRADQESAGLAGWRNTSRQAESVGAQQDLFSRDILEVAERYEMTREEVARLVEECHVT